ncbi:MAG TPA: ATP-binding protein [Streptosporangiaceae bacterium]|nr:ATP-binding protein [Streptosporangiaceae bacterium]
MGDEPPRRTLAARLEDRDRSRFTGRADEVAFLDRCLDADDPPASVVHICGPGGVGKSTLLREIARHARDRGVCVVAVDGRELGPAPGAIEAALRKDEQADRLLVLLDSYERMTALDSYLRQDLLPELPDRALVLIAGRGAPDPGWFTGGWEAVTARIDLTALRPREARRLLAARGLTDDRVNPIVDWAAGSPLALALAADAAIADADWNAASAPGRPEILRALLHRLVETELHDVRPSALGIAVVARNVTPDLLRAVLPAENADAAYRELSELTITERLGTGLTMHDLARKALLADLRQRNPLLERDLRRRVADYLYSQGIAGDQMMMIEMAHLVENPLLRWGFSWDGNVSFRIDSVRPGDAAAVEALTTDHNPRWWQLTRRYFTEAPDRVAIARDLSDRICGFLVSMSLATAPAFADDDPLAGPWLAHARRNAALGDSVMWHAAVDFTGQGKVQAMLGIAGVLRCGSASPRFAYLPIDPRLPGAVEFAHALGAAHLAELDARLGGDMVQCHRLDYGPGGLFTFMRDQIYSELGLPVPVPVRRPVADLDTVREILKNFRVPRELARSPLAQGSSIPERAESVQRLVWQAADEAFGDSETEKLLRSVLIAGYLEPMRSHEEAASKLLLSRAAYFRRLRTAVERLAEHMAAGPAPADVA